MTLSPDPGAGLGTVGVVVGGAVVGGGGAGAGATGVVIGGATATGDVVGAGAAVGTAGAVVDDAGSGRWWMVG